MIDFTKPVQTRSGLPIRILCTDGPKDAPIVGIHKDSVYSWHSNGKFYETKSQYDLINVPEPIEIDGWFNVYPDKSIHSNFYHKSKGDADYAAHADRIACIPIKLTCHKGDGL